MIVLTPTILQRDPARFTAATLRVRGQKPTETAAVLGDLTRGTRGQSVVMVSHRPDGMERFDRVIDLSQPTGDAANR